MRGRPNAAILALPEAQRAVLTLRDVEGLSAAEAGNVLGLSETNQSPPEEERQRFEAQLALCPSCETYLEQMRLTVRPLGALREEDVPPTPQRRLLAAFRHWARRLGR